MPLAMIRLASLNERGVVSGKPDLVKAWVYAQQAVDASKEAKDAVAYRDALEKAMSPEQKAEAKKVLEQKKADASKNAPASAPAAPAAAPASGAASKAKGPAKK
jgi:hypothetical protein